MTKFYIGLILILILVVSIFPVYAVDLGISPPDINLTLNRGDEYRGELYIFGSEKETLEVNGYANDWSLTTNGSYQFLPVGTLKRSASPWISFEPKAFRLPPKRGQKINYTIKVPSNASGSYWGTLLFGSTQPMQQGRDQLQILMAGRVAYIIRIDVFDSPPGRGSIERFKLSWDGTKKKPEAVLRVKNSGSSFVRFKGRLELKDGQGKQVASIPFREGYVLPDYTREFMLQDNEVNLPPGFYVGVAVADFGDKSLKAIQSTMEVK